MQREREEEEEEKEGGTEGRRKGGRKIDLRRRKGKSLQVYF